MTRHAGHWANSQMCQHQLLQGQQTHSLVPSTNFPVAVVCSRPRPQPQAPKLARAGGWLSGGDTLYRRVTSSSLAPDPALAEVPRGCALSEGLSCLPCFPLRHAGPRAPPVPARGGRPAGAAPTLRPAATRTPAPPGCRGLRHGTGCTSLCGVGTTAPAAHRLSLSLVFSVVTYLNIKMVVPISNIASKTQPPL